MRVHKHFGVLISCVVALLCFTGTAQAAITAQMNLEQLVSQSERVFVGRVISITESRVSMGGGELPAVTYRLAVSDTFKGQFEEIKGERFTEVTTIGSLKQVLSGQHPITDFPILQKGVEYLLFIAPSGPTGMTATMGLGQGCFHISGSDDNKVALNLANNTGLFSGMNTGFADGEAVPYSVLAEMIQSIVGGS